MELRRSDSSGTDDDLPPSHSGPLTAGRGRFVGNGKPSTTYNNGGTKNIDHLVRTLEQDAYTAVLRAFGAQSEHITWAKELLMADLRKELRVPDEQHRELLAKVALDDSIRQIREWRESGDNSTPVPVAGNITAAPAPAAASPAPPPRKKQKTGAVSQVTMPPPPTPVTQTPAAPVPPKPSKKHSSTIAPRGKNKGSSEKTSSQGVRENSSQGRPPQSKRKDGHLDTQDRFVGQTLKVRWHEDNNFYEAFVKEYHQEDGTHTLVYDVGTENVTSERVDLSKMAPEDIQSNGALERKAPAKNLHHQTFKRRDKTKRPARLSAVDSLAKQVEELERGADLTRIEQAKRLAKEQLESVLKALREVGESSDEDSGNGGARQRDSYSRNMIAKSDDDNDRRHANGDRS